MKLYCGVYSEGSVFSVEIKRDAKVSELQKAIFEDQRYHERYTFDASMLTLYLARKKEGGESKWLKDDNNLDALLRKDADERFTKMRSSWKLTKEELLGPSFKPGEEEIQVLVGLPDVPEVAVAAYKKPRLAWRSTWWGSHVYDPDSRSFLLEKEDVEESGLPPVRLMLYCRPTFHSQFEFMDDKVLNKGHLGWILGPPGAGKSTTAMAFASTVDRSEWNVTWLHVEKNLDLKCVRLVGEERLTRTITVAEVYGVLQLDDSKKHLLLVDGWKNADSFIPLTIECHEWLKMDRVKRRLAFVCSEASRGEVEDGTDIRMRVMEFNVWSWTLDEYHTAIEDDEVWKTVSPYLDARNVLPGEEMSRAAMLESKYHYAGGSCRDMFGLSTATVMERLSSAVNSLNHAATHETSVQRLLSSIDRLQAMFKQPGCSIGSVSPVISRYAATLIAVRCGPEMIKAFILRQRDGSSLALDGWMLDMAFFARLRHGGLVLLDAAGREDEKWGESAVVTADGIPALSSAHPVWIKPEKWRQGGYDAIMVYKRTQHVRFVQVASAHKHSFRIEYFYGWLKMLSESESQSFEVKKLEIFFVVEQDKLSTFKITTVTGAGLLQPFGWAKGREIERVRVVGTQGYIASLSSTFLEHGYQLLRPFCLCFGTTSTLDASIINPIRTCRVRQ